MVYSFPSLGRGFKGEGKFDSRLLKLTDVKRSGCQTIFIYSYLGKTVTKFIIDNSFASMPLSICASKLSLTSCPPGFCFY